MVAGRDLAFERFEKARAEGGQCMEPGGVALPREDEEAAPHFANYSGDALPTEQRGGMWMRLIAGGIDGTRAAAETHSPMFYAHIELTSGATLSLPREYPERAAFVVSGSVSVDGRDFTSGQMLVFAPGEAIVRANSPATLMILGGEPIGERYLEWNFVSSSKERIEQAKPIGGGQNEAARSRSRRIHSAAAGSAAASKSDVIA